jgi:hypothetical protein
MLDVFLYKDCAALKAVDNGSTVTQTYDPFTLFCLGEQAILSPTTALLAACEIFISPHYLFVWILMKMWDVRAVVTGIFIESYLLLRSTKGSMVYRSFLQIVRPTSSAPVGLLKFPKEMKVPRHIAVIMDGNRRYGKQHFGSAR